MIQEIITPIDRSSLKWTNGHRRQLLQKENGSGRHNLPRRRRLPFFIGIIQLIQLDTKPLFFGIYQLNVCKVALLVSRDLILSTFAALRQTRVSSAEDNVALERFHFFTELS